MSRRFREHDRRRTLDLSGFWDFAFLGDLEPDDVEIGRIAYDDVAAVPGNFDATPRYAGRRGLAAYRTTAPATEDGHYQLVLDGVHHWSRVFIGGEARCDHVGGFTRFACEASDLPPGEVEIVVLADNRFDYGRCPLHLDDFDWYHYGGLARGAQWHRLGTHWIRGLRVAVDDLQTRTVSVFIDYTCYECSGARELAISCDGREILRDRLDLQARYGRIRRTVRLDGAALWSPEQPDLHRLHVQFGDDDMRERIGLRTVEVRGRDILINGTPQRLVGFNRHEAHPQFGHGLPDQLLVADVQQLEQMGCNFVRGSHYPQDLRFLDLCDEAGICVWSESIGWQHSAEHLNDPRFLDAQIRNANEMVSAALNRPCVILWGILNESASHDPAGRAGYEKLLGNLRRIDPTRPVTYACNHPMDDKCMDLADVVSINTYPGWYGGEIESIEGCLDEIAAHFDEIGQGDKPMIISEIGAGALYGWRDAHETRWSEQYQARLLETVIRAMFEKRDRFCGLAVWQFCDCRTTQQPRKAIGRPRAFNNKGVVDEYRRAKEAFATVRSLFRRIRGLD